MSAAEPRQVYTVVIANTGERYPCRADQSLLTAMEGLGRKGIPVGCRGGGCGVCKVRIETGTVRCERMSRAHVSVEEEACGHVLACRAFPVSDLDLRAVARMARCLERSKPGSPVSQISPVSQVSQASQASQPSQASRATGHDPPASPASLPSPDTPDFS